MDNSFAVPFDAVLNQKTAFLVFMIAALFHKKHNKNNDVTNRLPH